MLHWIRYPLSDLEIIRKRQEAIAWNALPELPITEEEVDFIDRLFRYDSTRYVISRGVNRLSYL